MNPECNLKNKDNFKTSALVAINSDDAFTGNATPQELLDGVG